MPSILEYLGHLVEIFNPVKSAFKEQLRSFLCVLSQVGDVPEQNNIRFSSYQRGNGTKQDGRKKFTLVQLSPDKHTCERASFKASMAMI